MKETFLSLNWFEFNDGIGVAKPKAAVSFEEYKQQVIGIVWESNQNEGVKKVNVAVGIK